MRRASAPRVRRVAVGHDGRMHFVIAGASGFLGTHLTEHLRDAGTT